MLMTLSTAAMLLIPAANNHAQNNHADVHRQGKKIVVVNPDRDGRYDGKKRKDKKYAKDFARQISVRANDVRRINECRRDPRCSVNYRGRRNVVLSFVNATHSNREFQRTMFELKNARFESERVNVIAHARLRRLSSSQVLALLGCLRYESSKLRAIRILAPVASEGMNRYELASVFRYSSSIREAKRIFREASYRNDIHRPTVVATHW